MTLVQIYIVINRGKNTFELIGTVLKYLCLSAKLLCESQTSSASLVKVRRVVR